nr:MAG TPA: hypothetical protein [Caudoviricetes sp.]
MKFLLLLHSPVIKSSLPADYPILFIFKHSRLSLPTTL